MSFGSKQVIDFIGSTNQLANGIYVSSYLPLSMTLAGVVSSGSAAGNYLFYNGGLRYNSQTTTSSYYYIIYVTNLLGSSAGGWALAYSTLNPASNANVTPTFVLDSRDDYFDIYDTNGVFFQNIGTLASSSSSNPTGFNIPNLIVGNDYTATVGTDAFFVPSYTDFYQMQDLTNVQTQAAATNDSNTKCANILNLFSSKQRGNNLVNQTAL